MDSSVRSCAAMQIRGDNAPDTAVPKQGREGQAMPTLTTQTGDALATTADALVVLTFAREALPDGLDARFDGQLTRALAAARFTGKHDEVAAYATFGRLPAKWVVL